VPQQVGEEADHGPRDAGHLDQQAEQHEQRHGEKDQMAHALVHAADHDERGRVGGQRDVAERRESERERDRYTEQHEHRNTHHEKHEQVPVAEWPERARAQQREPANDQCSQAEREEHVLHLPEPEDLQQADEQHQPEPDRQGGRTPGVHDPHRRRRHVNLVLRDP
jgi:hypothetical protein